jgi:L-ascorbate metabolism protein UlaG (beta-lactamase superfamily)
MKALVISVLLFFIQISTYTQQLSKDLQITYLANEGFLLKSPTRKVLIDALFTEGFNTFAVPKQETINDIIAAKPPFDQVDLFFLTHYHGDHCNSWLMNDYLTKNRSVPLVTSKPSIVFINGNCFNFILLKKQFREITPELNQSISQIINNIPVKVFGLKHLSFYRDSIDMEENMFNESFLFDLDGIKVFHSGDIMKNAFEGYLEKNKNWTDSVDVAFIYYKLLDDLDYVVTTLHPKYIVPIHIPPKQTEKWEIKMEALKAKFPNIIFFKNSLDVRTIGINGL